MSRFYLAENIWVTTSGNFNTQALHCTILTMGADRILFSNDYPYEDYAEGEEFIDTAPISESTVAKSLTRTPRHSTSCRRARKPPDPFSKN